FIYVLTIYEIAYFFFFQAEDAIRDRNVTGVQTCALPISNGPSTHSDVADACPGPAVSLGGSKRASSASAAPSSTQLQTTSNDSRSEERRVGKERITRYSSKHKNRKREK